MDKYWIIGHPLDFSLSTPVLNALFKEMGIKKEFESKDIKPSGLKKVINSLREGELKGLITTMPHKTPSISLVDKVSEEARKIDAVNLTINEKGKLVSYNTDYMGAVGALKTVLPSLKGVKIHVLGAGGAARAAAFGFQKEGALVSIWNRTPDRAKEFAEKLGIEWIEDMRTWDGKPDVIVNATSVSYQTKQSTLVPFALWEKVTTAMDAVYGKTSLFLEEANAMNVKNLLTGELWFVNQAIPMFKLITGKEAPKKRLEELTKEALSNL
ncbi:hypothetical protein KKC94_02520 [Patescibacteria group bacterium]|nr:hypothetical protein [Patescibacteria group bacterium]